MGSSVEAIKLAIVVREGEGAKESKRRNNGVTNGVFGGTRFWPTPRRGAGASSRLLIGLALQNFYLIFYSLTDE